MSKFEITVGSVPYREELVATIYYNKHCWVEISHDKEEMEIQFFAHPKDKYWEFPLEESLRVLEDAKKKLLSLGPKNPTPVNDRFK